MIIKSDHLPPGLQAEHIARKEAERQLSELRRELEEIVSDLAVREEWNQSILEAVAEGIFVLDPTGNFTFLNTAACKMLGWSEQELLGRHSHELIHHSHPDGTPCRKEQCPIYKSSLGNHEVLLSEDLFWRKDGSSFPIEYFCRPIRAENGVGLVVSFRDISARIKAEHERNYMEVQLRQAQKLEAIGQLAAGIAHEINTPTQFVSDNTHFLQEAFNDLLRFCAFQEQVIQESGPPANVQAELEALAAETDLEHLKTEIPLAIQQSLDGLQRITRIVRAMKEFSHPGENEKIPIDINQALTSTIDVSRNEWKYHAEMITDFDPALPLIYCLAGELNQAFLNIIVNAAHAIAAAAGSRQGEKGVITITTRQDGQAVRISISDTGSGIPETVLPRIFDPFFTTKGVGKGTGQGLAIAYSAVVDKHGGSINVKTDPESGTTFTIRLPIGDKQDKPDSDT